MLQSDQRFVAGRSRKLSTRDSTIFALSSGRGKCGVAVFRISGPEADSALTALAGRPLPAIGTAALRQLRDPNDGEAIDDALVVRFARPASYTGEDSVELQAHGSPAVAKRLLATLGRIPGLRAAEPGEFTRRAFENGKLDLAQIEGLADLIEAETESQRRLALRSMRGEPSDRIANWRSRIIRCLAPVEALVDFPEEIGEDAPEGHGVAQALQDELGRELPVLQCEIRKELRGHGAAERLRSGIDIAVIGPPNVGKSSLINALVGREIALSTPEPGTTRDVLEAHLEISGLPVTVLDTAGLREAEGLVEALGVERAEQRAQLAELRIHVSAPDVREPHRPEAADRLLWRDGDIRVMNKSDLGGADVPADAIHVSAKSGDGLSDLVDEIAERLSWVEGIASPTASNERKKRLLEACLSEIGQAEARLDCLQAPELLAEHLRLAVRELERFAGRLDVEEVLDLVFSQFCLGK